MDIQLYLLSGWWDDSNDPADPAAPLAGTGHLDPRQIRGGHGRPEAIRAMMSPDAIPRFHRLAPEPGS